MNVKFMMLCQHATDVNGIINVLNAGLNNIVVPGFPTMASLTIWIQAGIEKKDVGMHRYTLTVRSADGQIVQIPQPDGKKVPLMIEMNANIQRNPNAPEVDKKIAVTNLLAVTNVYFEKAGVYQFRCDLDGTSSECQLYVDTPQLAGG